MKTRSFRPTTLVLVSLFLFGACSSDSSKASTPSSSRQTLEKQAVEKRAGAIDKLDPAEFQTFMTEHPEVPLVNVHIPYEQHILSTSAFVAFDAIADWDDLPKDLDAPIALYCRSGNMSGQASDTLAALGHTNITDLAGGMNAWSAAGFPLVDQDPATG